jgi:hypothetical protein
MADFYNEQVFLNAERRPLYPVPGPRIKPQMTRPMPSQDSDISKGASETPQDSSPNHGNNPTRPDLHGNLSGQLPHRSSTRQNNALTGDNGTDFPEPGSSPEHSGEKSS